MKKVRSLSLVLALLMAVSLVLSGCGKEKLGIKEAEKDPLKYLQNALDRTEKALLPDEDSPTVKLFSAMSKQGTLSLEMEGTDGGPDLDASVAYNNDKNVVYSAVEVSAGGQQVKLQFWLTDKELCLKAPELLGDTAYGMPFENLKESVAQSQIWAAAGMRYDSVKDTVEPVLEQLEKSLQAKQDGMADKISQAFDKIKLVFNKIQYTAVEADDSVRINCTMTKEQMNKLADTLIEIAEDQVLPGLENIPTDAGSLELIAVQLRAALEELCGEVQLQFAISNKTGLITAANLVYTPDGSSLIHSFELDVNMKDLTNIVIKATVCDSSKQKSTLQVKIRNNDSDEKINRKVTIKADDKEVLTLSYTYSGTNFKLQLSSDGESVVLNGKCKLSEERLRLYDLKFTADGEETEIPIKLTLSAKSDIKTMPSYTNMPEMSEVEWKKLIATIGSIASPDITIQ